MTDPIEAISRLKSMLANVDAQTSRDNQTQYVHDIRALLDRLDSAERDQRRYQWLRGNVGEISTSAFEDMQFYGEPGDTQDALRLDAAIDAALRAGEQKEPK